METQKGSCHCGAVTYDVTADLSSAIKCNCSHCKRKGFLLSFVPESAFSLMSGHDHLTSYQFNKHLIDHQFCKTCGVQSFARGSDGEGNKMIAINLNCVENLDLDKVEVREFDGASM